MGISCNLILVERRELFMKKVYEEPCLKKVSLLTEHSVLAFCYSETLGAGGINGPGSLKNDCVAPTGDHCVYIAIG